MWFDTRAKLAEIASHPSATSATTATQAPAGRVMSQLSQLSQAPESGKPVSPVAVVASVATSPPAKSHQIPPARAGGAQPDPDGFPYGTACDLGLFPRTWTGRIVSLAGWRDLTEWERHGPRGRHWNAATARWEQPEATDKGQLKPTVSILRECDIITK